MLGSSRSRFEVFMFNWIAQPDCGTYQFRRTLGGTCTLQRKENTSSVPGQNGEVASSRRHGTSHIPQYS